MSVKHTQGEWFRSGTEIVSMPSQVKISNRISGATYEEAIANAKLIEQAPKMRKALQEISILQEEKMLNFESRITQDTVKKINSILKILGNE